MITAPLVAAAHSAVVAAEEVEEVNPLLPHDLRHRLVVGDRGDHRRRVHQVRPAEVPGRPRRARGEDRRRAAARRGRPGRGRRAARRVRAAARRRTHGGSPHQGGRPRRGRCHRHRAQGEGGRRGCAHGRDGPAPDRGRASAGGGLAAQRRGCARHRARLEDRRRVPRGHRPPVAGRRPLPRGARGDRRLRPRAPARRTDARHESGVARRGTAPVRAGAGRGGCAGGSRSASSCSPSSTPWTPRARCGGPCPTPPSTATPRPGWSRACSAGSTPASSTRCRTSCRSRWSSADDLIEAVEQPRLRRRARVGAGRQGARARRGRAVPHHAVARRPARGAPGAVRPAGPRRQARGPRGEPAARQGRPTPPSRWHGGRPRPRAAVASSRRSASWASSPRRGASASWRP